MEEARTQGMDKNYLYGLVLAITDQIIRSLKDGQTLHFDLGPDVEYSCTAEPSRYKVVYLTKKPICSAAEWVQHELAEDAAIDMTGTISRWAASTGIIPVPYVFQRP